MLFAPSVCVVVVETLEEEEREGEGGQSDRRMTSLIHHQLITHTLYPSPVPSCIPLFFSYTLEEDGCEAANIVREA